MDSILHRGIPLEVYGRYGVAVIGGGTAGAAAAIPLRDREDVDADAPVGVRSAIPLLVAGNAAVLIGIFVARLMFYALQV